MLCLECGLSVGAWEPQDDPMQAHVQFVEDAAAPTRCAFISKHSALYDAVKSNEVTASIVEGKTCPEVWRSGDGKEAPDGGSPIQHAVAKTGVAADAADAADASDLRYKSAVPADPRFVEVCLGACTCPWWPCDIKNECYKIEWLGGLVMCHVSR